MRNSHFKIEIGFGIGLNRHGNHIPYSTREAKLANIRSRATNLFSGCTIVPTMGTWTSPAGTLFTEEGRTLIVYVPAVWVTPDGATVPAPDSMASISGLIRYIKDQLEQEAVALVTTPVNFDIV